MLKSRYVVEDEKSSSMSENTGVNSNTKATKKKMKVFGGNERGMKRQKERENNLIQLQMEKRKGKETTGE